MKSSLKGKNVLFIAPAEREAEPVLEPLQAAGHLVSLVADLEAAQALLVANGFDQAVIPAQLLQTLLERYAAGEATDSESWRRSAAGIILDLRSLLHALERSIEEMQQGERPSRAFAESLRDIRRRTAVLTEFLYELIVELTNGGSETLHLAELDLEDAVEAAAVAVYPTATEKGQRLVIDITHEATTVRADSVKLRRALTSLLDYAVRQSSQFGTVVVRAQRENDDCVISVSGSAEGVAGSKVPRPSHIATAGSDADSGLARAKRTVEQHGGRLWIDSRQGSGTTVHISLPQLGTERSPFSGTRPIAE